MASDLFLLSEPELDARTPRLPALEIQLSMRVRSQPFARLLLILHLSLVAQLRTASAAACNCIIKFFVSASATLEERRAC
jgi:hypothetical protein